jgi:hypothetical protein
MKIWPVVASLIFTTSVSAQIPYAGMQTRPIKALSDQQIADLRAGRGMGLALAAELNGYPGPSHVLELADRLELSTDQRAGVQRLFDSMKAEAVPLGSKLLEQEDRSGQAIRQPRSDGRDPQGVHCSDSCNARGAAGDPSQVSFVDGRHPYLCAKAEICGIARIWRRPSAPPSMIALFSGLYPANQPVMVRSRDISIDRKSVGPAGTALPPVAFLNQRMICARIAQLANAHGALPCTASPDFSRPSS